MVKKLFFDTKGFAACLMMNIIDRFTITNRDLKAKELVIWTNDQHLIVGLVCLIGNMCYRCRENQDLVRQTDVPVPSSPISDPILPNPNI